MTNQPSLSASQLADIALAFLGTDGGFTLDRHSNSQTGDFWAVSTEKDGEQFYGIPSKQEVEQYLLKHPIYNTGKYFGGWYGGGDGITCLDHTLLFEHKHTAVQEGLRQKQKTIYHLGTGETLQLDSPEVPGLSVDWQSQKETR